MKPPILNERLALEDKQTVSDGAGGSTETWVVLGTVWASLSPLKGTFVAGETDVLARQNTTVVVRGAARSSPQRPKPGQRFRKDDRCFDIISVHELGSGGLYLSCACREQVTP